MRPLSAEQLADALEAVDYQASLSPSTGRKTGCVIIDDTGWHVDDCNGFPPGVRPDTDRADGEARHRFLEHAERNAIFTAVRVGFDLDDSTFVLRWFPCVECARAIAGVGASRLYCSEPDWDEPRYHFRDARKILEESGVEIVFAEKAK